jgi:hypothetical protein
MLLSEIDLTDRVFNHHKQPLFPLGFSTMCGHKRNHTTYPGRRQDDFRDDDGDVIMGDTEDTNFEQFNARNAHTANQGVIQRVLHQPVGNVHVDVNLNGNVLPAQPTHEPRLLRNLAHEARLLQHHDNDPRLLQALENYTGLLLALRTHPGLLQTFVDDPQLLQALINDVRLLICPSNKWLYYLIFILILIIIIPGSMAASYVWKQMLIDASRAAITDVVSQDIRTLLAFGGWYYPAANWMPQWVVERGVNTVLSFTGVDRRVGEAIHQHIAGSWLDRLPARSIDVIRGLIAR